jgi:SanA protein
MRRKKTIKVIKKLILYGAIFWAIIFLFVFIINLSVHIQSKKHITHSIKGLSWSSADAVMILGARVYPDGRISEIYLERINTAIKVYQSGYAHNILISADNSYNYYDEVRPVAKYLLDHGIPIEDIFLDFAGFDTYDSMYRAQSIFGVKKLIVCSQDFHVPRAVYIAQNLGIDVLWIEAEWRQWSTLAHTGREKIANIKAWLELLFNVNPYFGGEAIPISGEGNAERFLD